MSTACLNNLEIILFETDFECCPLGTLPFYLHFTGHRTKYFLISRHPQDQGLRSNRLLDPYDSLSWMFIALSIALLTILIIITVKVYGKINMTVLQPGLDSMFLFLRTTFGVTEPDRIKIVRMFTLSSGNLNVIIKGI